MNWMKGGFLAILVLATLVIAGCTTPLEPNDTGEATPVTTGPAEAGQTQNVSDAGEEEGVLGRFAVTVTDEAVDLGQVSSVSMQVESIRLHNATAGWQELSFTPKTIDLAQLRQDAAEIPLVDTYVAEGAYDRIELVFSNPTVVDAAGAQNATMPSTEFTLTTNLTVTMDAAAVARFDFLADQSLFVTQNGEYVIAPVANVTAFSGVGVISIGENRVDIGGGTVTGQETVGMNADGTVQPGGGIPPEAMLVVEDGQVRAVSASGNQTG